ncbi:MAG: PAS domain S-box protein [Desulfobacterales bacterium]|nr:PAS domain S-box protein [Desulfobacterales bacterium]
MKKPSDDGSNTKSNSRSDNRPMDRSIARLMGLGERSIQKSYYPQLQRKIRELEKSESRYRLLAENVSDVIWLLNAKGQMAYISPSINRMGGYEPEKLIGRPFTDLLAPDYIPPFKELIEKQMISCALGQDSRKTGNLELLQNNADGSNTWIEIKMACVPGKKEDATQVLGISRDITERKKAAQEKKEMELQLLQAQKMESIGTLAGGIAHDFNNLLTVINGYTDLINSKLKPDHPFAPKIKAISHAGRKAEELTRQLLAFSRKQVFSPSPIDLNKTIRSMDKILRRLIGEDIQVETITEKTINPISADQTQIEQIFTNLVVNARDALSEVKTHDFKKRITIETGQTMLKQETAEKLGLKIPGEYVFFSVSDNGEGMDRATRKRIFEPFFTTKAKNKGTGLGLAVIYGIVKQNNGSIRVYSEPEQGSLFKVYWPADNKSSSESAMDFQAGKQDLSGDERLLVVEDNSEVLNFTANALKSLGYEVFKAENGAKAFEWFKSRIDNSLSLPHLVITDLIMPEMGGQAFAQQSKALWPHLKVLFVSGHTDNHIVHNGMLEKGVNFLQKPYTQQQLAEKIRQVLSRKDSF